MTPPMKNCMDDPIADHMRRQKVGSEHLKLPTSSVMGYHGPQIWSCFGGIRRDSLFGIITIWVLAWDLGWKTKYRIAIWVMLG